MRRLRRHILNTLTLLSLALCLATVLLWIRSHRVADQVEWRNAGGWRFLRSTDGQLELNFLRSDWSPYPSYFHSPRYHSEHAAPPHNFLLEMNGNLDDTLVDWEHAGLAWHHRRNIRRGTLHAHALVPFWAIAAATLAIPMARAALRFRARARNRHRQHIGLCPTCGYDLRATPDRCPECGAQPTR